MNFNYLQLFIILIVAGMTVELAEAQNRPGDREAGVILGEPTGISAKFWRDGNSAYDLGLAWSFGRGGKLHIHSNYLIHRSLDPPDVYFYYGLGARLLFRDDPEAAARVPAGIQYFIPDTRLTLFLEIAPMLNLIPETKFLLNGGLGMRIFI